ncbi:MAG TPA: hypothetical protein VFS39_13635 [Nitrospira sp.]|nr:hypothetical protein [Nitrospira sp.]
MARFKISMAVSLLSQIGLIGGLALTVDAATTFNGSTIIGVDTTKPTVTFRTKEGEHWTLPLADPELLKRQEIAKGDRVSIEIDLDDRITGILKSSGQVPPPESIPRDDQ